MTAFRWRLGFGAGAGTIVQRLMLLGKIVDGEALWQSLTVDSDVEVVDEVSGRAKKLVRVGHGEALTTNLHVAPDHILVL